MKRMLEVRDDGSVAINSSSIDIITSCKRKAQYALDMGMRREDESEAITFGKAIHAGLDVFYSSQKRNLNQVLEAFVAAAQPISFLPPTEKRSIDNGTKILSRYYEVYQNDPWVAYVDDQGPFIERSFELPWGDSGHSVHGTIDALLRNTETGELVACDHKTATSLSDLANKAKPNLQFSVYVWALQKMGHSVKRMMVNGIQVAKTKSDFVRIFTDRDQDDFSEMSLTINSAINDYKFAKKNNSWPMSTSSCANYGGCQYLDVCSLNSNLRDQAISRIYSGLGGQFRA